MAGRCNRRAVVTQEGVIKFSSNGRDCQAHQSRLQLVYNYSYNLLDLRVGVTSDLPRYEYRCVLIEAVQFSHFSTAFAETLGEGSITEAGLGANS